MVIVKPVEALAASLVVNVPMLRTAASTDGRIVEAVLVGAV